MAMTQPCCHWMISRKAAVLICCNLFQRDYFCNKGSKFIINCCGIEFTSLHAWSVILSWSTLTHMIGGDGEVRRKQNAKSADCYIKFVGLLLPKSLDVYKNTAGPVWFKTARFVSWAFKSKDLKDFIFLFVSGRIILKQKMRQPGVGPGVGVFC